MRTKFECENLIHPLARTADVVAVPAVLDTPDLSLPTDIAAAVWFDANGFECDPEDAEFTVIGPGADGNWRTVELGDAADRRVH